MLLPHFMLSKRNLPHNLSPAYTSALLGRLLSVGTAFYYHLWARSSIGPNFHWSSWLRSIPAARQAGKSTSLGLHDLSTFHQSSKLTPPADTARSAAILDHDHEKERAKRPSLMRSQDQDKSKRQTQPACLAAGMLRRLVFGTLYPAYSSYKAVKTKNVREYVKWMMYWIVFAIFTAVETFTDLLLAWFPFYYEMKIMFVVWLLSPYTKGSSVLYRKFVHPTLSSKEKEIDEYIVQARERGYETVMQFGRRGFNIAATAAASAAAKGALAERLRSFSMHDLTLIPEDQPRGGGRSARGEGRARPASMLDPIQDSDEPDFSRSEGETTEVKTDLSDEEAMEQALPKRTQSLRTTKSRVVIRESTNRATKTKTRKKAMSTGQEPV
uniref:receptor expression-enhancing protein 2-like isoform X2 n=1 Tax=Myxine glutinosa TaxID=7769 RepID=UPI00358FDC11